MSGPRPNPSPARVPTPAPTPPPAVSKDDRDLAVVKKMFIGGCFFLPLLWIFVLLHYRRRWFDEDCPRPIKHYLRLCLGGLILSTIVLVTWVTVFQTTWQSWGVAGTNLLMFEPNSQWWNQ